MHTEASHNPSYAVGFVFQSTSFFTLENCVSNFTVEDLYYGDTISYAVGRSLNGGCEATNFSSTWTNGWC